MSNSVRPHRRQPTRLHRPWDSPGKDTGVGCHFLLQCMKVKSESEVAQSCLTLCDPMDCSLPGSFLHGIFQARVLEWVAIAMFIAALFTVAKIQKHHKCPWRDKWIEKLQYRTSLVVQWSGICLSMKVARDWSWSGEIPHTAGQPSLYATTEPKL